MSNFRPFRLLSIAAISVLPMAAMAENHAPAADAVVATVNGKDITLGHMIALYEQLPQQYKQLGPQALYQGILQQLIEQEALAQANGDELSDRMQIMLENQRRAMLASRQAVQVRSTGISDEAIEKYYQDNFGVADGTVEWNASHILVETEAEALELIDALNGGADFATLAQEKSTGPSGPNGGQLGWFGAGQMVPPFELAVAAMEPETISAPVQTQFGWHVIRLNERRVPEAPKLADVRDQILQSLGEQAVRNHIAELVSAADVTRSPDTFDPTVLENSAILGE